MPLTDFFTSREIVRKSEEDETKDNPEIKASETGLSSVQKMDGLPAVLKAVEPPARLSGERSALKLDGVRSASVEEKGDVQKKDVTAEQVLKSSLKSFKL